MFVTRGTRAGSPPFSYIICQKLRWFYHLSGTGKKVLDAVLKQFDKDVKWVLSRGHARWKELEKEPTFRYTKFFNVNFSVKCSSVCFSVQLIGLSIMCIQNISGLCIDSD